MINVISKLCIHSGCKTQPTYNYEGITTPLYCGVHKLDGMIPLKHKHCIYPNCKITPSYNKKGEKTPLYCSIHKLDNMCNVISKVCIFPECKTTACFNNESESNGLYCNVHKLNGMINVNRRYCIYPGCKITANYNKYGEKLPLYCMTHKLDTMVNITNKRCIYTDCDIRPNYNFEGSKTPIYCMKHSLEGMINITSKTCNSSWCKLIVLTDKYDGYCLHCFTHLFPDKPVSRNYKTKERCVVEYITSHFPDFSWVADKTITDGCSRRRPDLMLDLGYQVVIVEVDEDCHANYDCSCENKRIMEISQDVGHKPIVFIRFNPDEYTDANGESVTSCWGVNGKGICVVKKSKEKEWESRLEMLCEQVEYWTNPENATEKTVEIVELFYDCD
jgi:hypothetical protein